MSWARLEKGSEEISLIVLFLFLPRDSPHHNHIGVKKEMPLAIIGTAGRKEDAARLHIDMWKNIYIQVRQIIRERKITHLISGGAAWADHLAVQLFNQGEVEKLDLYLPARWNTFAYEEGTGYGTQNPGGTSNYYHRKFSERLGIESLEEIQAAIVHGASIHFDKGGFFGRNNLVAQNSDSVLALTFGSRDYEGAWVDANAAGLKDGGTAHTWNQCRHHEYVRHITLR